MTCLETDKVEAHKKYHGARLLRKILLPYDSHNMSQSIGIDEK